MADIEKVIKGLEICVDRVPGKYECNECPYEIDGNYCEINLAKDALALLKEQEAVISCKDCKYSTEPDENGFAVCMKIMHGCQSCGFYADGERQEGR